MEFVEPQPLTEPSNEKPISSESAVNEKTEETVHELESTVDKAYAAVESQVSELWKGASKNASEIQEKYKLEEKRKHLLELLNSTAVSINEKTHVKENLTQIEEQLKKLSQRIPKDIDLNQILKLANNALDALDSRLEVVEREAGKYVSSIALFFGSMVSIGPGTDTSASSGFSGASVAGGAKKDAETLFSVQNAENYGTSRYDSELFKLHTTASFYTTAGDGEEANKFDAESKTKEISALLKKYPNTLETLMNKLVPVEVSYEVFWQRYFKAEEELKASEAKRKELLAAKKEGGSKKDNAEGSDEEFTWDDDEEETE